MVIKTSVRLNEMLRDCEAEMNYLSNRVCRSLKINWHTNKLSYSTVCMDCLGEQRDRVLCIKTKILKKLF